MSKINKDTLTYLGNDFEIRLLAQIVKDLRFGNNIIDILDPNYFSDEYLRIIAAEIKEAKEVDDIVPDLPSLRIRLFNRINDDIKRKYIISNLLNIENASLYDSLKIQELPALYFDAIVISDYNKGTVSYELIEHIRREYAGPIFVDTKKKDLARLEGCIVKINAREFADAKTYASDLIVTNGSNGAKYQEMCWPSPQIPVVDVTGAGDTFLSALVYSYLLEHDLEKAIPFAIKAAALTVQHLGVYAPTLEEIA